MCVCVCECLRPFPFWEEVATSSNFILGIHDVIKIIHYYYTQMLCLVIYVYNKSTHNIWFSMMLSVTIIPPFTRQPLHDWHSKAMQ